MLPEGITAKVMIGSPLYSGDVAAEYVYSIMQSQMICLGKGILLEFQYIRNLSLIQCARNYLLHQFLEDKSFTHIMWIDGDLGWTPDAIARMVARKVDVIGGIYPRKADDISYPYEQGNTHPPRDGLVTAKRLPGGFILMSRECCQDLASQAKWYRMSLDAKDTKVPDVFALVIDKDGEMVSEDYILSDKLRALGYPLYVETDISFVHVGRRAWNGNLAGHLEQNGPHGKPSIWRGL